MTYKALNSPPVDWHCKLCGAYGTAQPDIENGKSVTVVALAQHEAQSPGCLSYVFIGKLPEAEATE